MSANWLGQHHIHSNTAQVSHGTEGLTDTIYANMKSARSGRGKMAEPNGRAVARPVRPFWPVI